MNTRKHMFALSSGLLLSMAGVVHAETATGESALRSEIATMKSRIAQLESQKSETWLNEQRAEEVKTLVREVLADADTRASLQGSGAVAGHNGKHFFLASEDGNYLLNVGGQIQVRYVYNATRGSDDSNESNRDSDQKGFEIARAKLDFTGHIGSPKIMYEVRLNADRNDETVRTEVVKVGYKVMDNLTVWAGEEKAPFLHEELLGDDHQLAVNSSYFNSIFTLGYVQGIWVNWEPTDMIRTSVALHDGSHSGEGDIESGKGWENDNTDMAIGGRIDVKLMGDWASYKDFSSWSGEDTSLVLGAATNWDVAETGDSGLNNKTWSWTVDASFKTAGFNFYAAYAWQQLQQDEIVQNDNVEIHGYMVQGGYMVIPDKLEPFVRYEWVEFDDPSITHDEVNMLTVGVNYYIKKHDAKFTLDCVWAMDAIESGAAPSDLGMLGLVGESADNGPSDQYAFRAQFQLLF
ncbi:MAG: OprO/OprP family phosphate-selective porin [Planctomycetes bacterium]|nr:OprO/OprP family phosphate-selective porin [Planctomycetota bacterium]